MKLSVIVICLLSLGISTYAQTDEGGTTAPDGKYPYHAALKKNSKYLCGASIINERWLLTAAHCAKIIKNPSEGFILVGTNKVTGENGTLYRIASVIQHERYDVDYIHSNDIALIRIVGTIKFSKKVQPIKLPQDDSKTYEGATAVLAGWGVFVRNTNPPTNLQHVKLEVISVKRCASEWKDARDRDITDTQLCTIGKTDENMATQGDSGGPLVSDGVQIGVMSFAWENLPDVFTRVSKYLPWINKYIQV